MKTNKFNKMKKHILFAIFSISVYYSYGQKLQLTEAATEFRNNYNNSWSSIPDSTLMAVQLGKNKTILLKAKKAIDESFLKQTTTPFVKSKDEAKMYYYRGVIYLEFMLASIFEGDLSLEDEIYDIISSSLKKCKELDVKNQWQNLIKTNIVRTSNSAINNGANFYNIKKYQKAISFFKISVLANSIIFKKDTTAILNIALTNQVINNHEEAYKYYKLFIQDLENPRVDIFYSILREIKLSDKLSDSVFIANINIAKNKFPTNFEIYNQEFSFWYDKGDNDKAQNALLNAVKADSMNKSIHYNIGILYFNQSEEYIKESNFEKAFDYMDQAVKSLQKALKLDSNYVDALYMVGATYYNKSQYYQSYAGEKFQNPTKYKLEMEKANNWKTNFSIPYFEKVIKIDPKEKATLKNLKSIYFSIEDTENENRIKKMLDSL
jgi:tetratricopeptide (TPR) repeat protein